MGQLTKCSACGEPSRALVGGKCPSCRIDDAYKASLAKKGDKSSEIIQGPPGAPMKQENVEKSLSHVVAGDGPKSQPEIPAPAPNAAANEDKGPNPDEKPNPYAKPNAPPETK